MADDAITLLYNIYTEEKRELRVTGSHLKAEANREKFTEMNSADSQRGAFYGNFVELTLNETKAAKFPISV